MENQHENSLALVSENSSQTTKEEITDLSWSQIFQKPYRKALIVGVAIGIFHQATGVSSLTFFSNEIFSKGYSGDRAELIARLGTLGTGLANVVGSFLAIGVSKVYGRKSILMAGEVAMSLLLAYLAN